MEVVIGDFDGAKRLHGKGLVRSPSVMGTYVPDAICTYCANVQEPLDVLFTHMPTLFHP